MHDSCDRSLSLQKRALLREKGSVHKKAVNDANKPDKNQAEARLKIQAGI